MGRGIFQYQCVYNSIEIQTTYFPSIMLEDDFIIEKKMLQDDLDLLEFMLGSMSKKKKKNTPRDQPISTLSKDPKSDAGDKNGPEMGYIICN